MIKVIITEDKLRNVREQIKEMIRTRGLPETSKIMGGFDNLISKLGMVYSVTHEQKVKDVHDIMDIYLNDSDYIDNEPRGAFVGGLRYDAVFLDEIGSDPIQISDDNDLIKQIPSLTETSAVVETYFLQKGEGSESDSYKLKDYTTVFYDTLSDEVLDNIIFALMYSLEGYSGD